MSAQVQSREQQALMKQHRFLKSSSGRPTTDRTRFRPLQTVTDWSAALLACDCADWTRRPWRSEVGDRCAPTRIPLRTLHRRQSCDASAPGAHPLLLRRLPWRLPWGCAELAGVAGSAPPSLNTGSVALPHPEFTFAPGPEGGGHSWGGGRFPEKHFTEGNGSQPRRAGGHPGTSPPPTGPSLRPDLGEAPGEGPAGLG